MPQNDTTGLMRAISEVHSGSADEARQIIAVLMEEAAKICEAQQQVFLSSQYATNQPMSSFGERFACGQCAKEIRNAAGLDDPHAR